MLFHVHAQDRPGIGSELYGLGEEHWSRTDRSEDRLVDGLAGAPVILTSQRRRRGGRN